MEDCNQYHKLKTVLNFQVFLLKQCSQQLWQDLKTKSNGYFILSLKRTFCIDLSQQVLRLFEINIYQLIYKNYASFCQKEEQNIYRIKYSQREK
ncbi:unnamed protein product [Paramecium pentaurelia]|uniref:Uncharacterized protein n=1 Tax=Paramecium pentaurelia TaxID=43138 RepID=A0A8S1TZU7_9CILI|nr:unnamed protein product [Paramecium pentaurelia]